MVHSTIIITMSLGHTHQSTPKQCITTKADYIRLTRGYISLILERESDVIVVSGPPSVGCSRSGVVIGAPKGTIRGGRFNCGLKGLCQRIFSGHIWHQLRLVSHHKQGQKDRRSHDEGYIQGRSQGRLTRQRGCPSLLSEGEILIIPEFQP